MNNLLHNKHFVFGDLGDFWYRQQSESNQYGVQFARAFSHLLDNNNAISDMSGVIQRLSGEGEVYKSNYTISFNPLELSASFMLLAAHSLSNAEQFKAS